MATCQDLTKHTKWLLESAREINSDLDKQQRQQLFFVRLFNSYLSAFSNELLLATGSCVEGCKVNVDDVKGDIDLMVICGSVELREDTFEYVDEYPAFLSIKGSETDAFRDAELINEIYVPASTLKDFSKSFFYMLRVFLMWIGGLPSMTSDGRASIPRPSAVGLESVDVTGVSGIGPILNEETCFLDVYPTFLNFLPNFTEAMLNICRKHGESHHIPPEFELTMKSLSTFASTIKNAPRKRKETALKRGTLDFLRSGLSVITSLLDVRNDENTTKSDDCSNKVDIDKGHGVIIEEIDMESDHMDDVKAIGEDDQTARSTQSMNSSSFDEPEQIFNNDLDTSSDEDIFEDCADEIQSQKTPFAMAVDKYSSVIEVESKAISTDNQPSVLMAAENRKPPSLSDTCLDQSENADDSLTSITAAYVLRSTDLVPAFRCLDWPQTAIEWITRTRIWPSDEIRNAIAESGCFLVAKYPPTGHLPLDVVSRHFRLSFSHVETVLANAMLPVQTLCWKVLKAYQIAFLKYDPKVLTSYHWKTAMLWISEQKPECFWIESNLLIAVTEVLDFMIECLEEGNVPHYFVRRMNLISGCEPATMDAVQLQLRDIRERPAFYLREFINNPPKPAPCVVELSRDDVDLMRRADVAEPWDRTVEEALHGLEGLAVYASKADYDDFNSDIDKCYSSLSKVVTETAMADGASDKTLKAVEGFFGFGKDVTSLVINHLSGRKPANDDDCINVLSQAIVLSGNLLSLASTDKQPAKNSKSTKERKSKKP